MQRRSPKAETTPAHHFHLMVNYIVFNSLRNDDQADLYIMRSNGDNQVQLTNHLEPEWGPQWAH